MRYNINSAYGQLAAMAIANGVSTFGKFFVVMPSTDPNYGRMQEMFVPDADGTVRLYNTLEAAYAAVTTNANDVIFLSAHSTHSLTDGIAWTKNRVHVIGLDGGNRIVQQGAKIELSGNVATAYVLKNTGVRNYFKNIKFIQSSTNAAALNVLQFGGEGNVYENCSALFGVNNNLGSVNASEVLNGEDSGMFINCSWGTDVLTSSAGAGRAVERLAVVTGGNADGAKSNRWINQEYVIMSSSNAAVCVKLNSAASAKFLNEWVNPRFNVVKNSTNSAIAITNAISSFASFVEGTLAFYNPSAVNVTNLCATVTDNVVVVGPAVSAQAGEGVTPS